MFMSLPNSTPLSSTIFPNSSINGQPHPNHFTMNCPFIQLYGTSKITNNRSGDTRTAVFFIDFIQSHPLLKFHNSIPIIL